MQCFVCNLCGKIKPRTQESLVYLIPSGQSECGYKVCIQCMDKLQETINNIKGERTRCITN